MDTTICILIRDVDGREIYVPREDYTKNPSLGTIVLSNRVHYPDPVVDRKLHTVGGVAQRRLHRALDPAFEGSSPSSPANSMLRSFPES